MGVVAFILSCVAVLMGLTALYACVTQRTPARDEQTDELIRLDARLRRARRRKGRQKLPHRLAHFDVYRMTQEHDLGGSVSTLVLEVVFPQSIYKAPFSHEQARWRALHAVLTKLGLKCRSAGPVSVRAVGGVALYICFASNTRGGPTVMVRAGVSGPYPA